VIYNICAITLAVISLACVVGAWLKRTKRVGFIWAAISAGVSAAAAYYNVFWVVASCSLMTLWALFTCLNVLTTAWRAKVGFSVGVGLGAALAFYPTIHDEFLCSGADDAIADTCPLKMNQMDPEERATLHEQSELGNAGLKRWILSNMGFRMVRGLDLKGGLRLVYTVDVEAAIKDKRDKYYDDLRTNLTLAFGLAAGEDPTVDEMRKLPDHLSISKPRDRTDTIIVTFKDAATAKQKMDQKFLTNFRRELNVVPSADGTVYTLQIRNDVETSIRESAVKQAKQTINRRVDGMGVKEAAISIRDEDIIIEIPGQDERAFAEIRDIISQTARLEFKMLDDAVNFFDKYTEADGLPEGLRFDIENAPLGPGRSDLSTYARITALKGESLEDSLKRLKEWTASLPIDEDHEIGYEKVYEYDGEKDEYNVVGWRTYYLWAKAELTGNMVRDASAQADQSDTGFGQWYVLMNLAPRGAEIFENITEANTKKRFAIILDGKVESAPEIREKIGGGVARITMGAGGAQQQYQDAKKLELVLKSGALPAPISPTNEQRIGPSLGADAIGQGVKAAGVGAFAVFVLMLLSYKRAGIIANFAVFFNLMLQLTVLSMFSASMTLPGIAGLALTIGMAVDANVLINERIKEELHAGKSARAAVQIGYDKAFSAIIDGNATTLISALILAQYGTGPIKGFAVTLIVGMLCNLFTGVVVTRLFFEFWVRGRRDIKLGIG